MYEIQIVNTSAEVELKSEEYNNDVSQWCIWSHCLDLVGQMQISWMFKEFYDPRRGNAAVQNGYSLQYDIKDCTE